MRCVVDIVIKNQKIQKTPTPKCCFCQKQIIINTEGSENQDIQPGYARLIPNKSLKEMIDHQISKDYSKFSKEELEKIYENER